jgi:putative transposase
MERYRITDESAVYFVTFSVVEWLPIFVSEPACSVVTKSLRFCNDHKSLRINAYVIMPTHFHAILFDQNGDSKRLQKSISEFRRFTGHELCNLIDERYPNCFRQTIRNQPAADRDRQLWQSSRHPEQIETQPFWKAKLDYTHLNPVRKGLVRRAIDWRFSSAAWYVSDREFENDVPLTVLDWD